MRYLIVTLLFLSGCASYPTYECKSIFPKGGTKDMSWKDGFIYTMENAKTVCKPIKPQ